MQKTPDSMIAILNKYKTITHPLKPLYRADSKILILGSFPSVKTREYGFFYGHPQNRFWHLLELIFEVELSREIEERRAFLLERRIAVYDVIYRCDIIGSSDASIQNAVPSDLTPIFREADIKQVFCNGGTSHSYYRKYQEQKTGAKAIKLPSTSPANARASMNDLYEQWKIIGEYIK